jgi:hypothetical protein
MLRGASIRAVSKALRACGRARFRKWAYSHFSTWEFLTRDMKGRDLVS